MLPPSRGEPPIEGRLSGRHLADDDQWRRVSARTTTRVADPSSSMPSPANSRRPTACAPVRASGAAAAAVGAAAVVEPPVNDTSNVTRSALGSALNSPSEITHLCVASHTRLLEPNGPADTVYVPLTFPSAPTVRVLILARSQSPAPVEAPWSLHSLIPSVLPAVKPVPVTVTTVPFVSPSCGEMVPAGLAWATPASTNRNAPASVISANVRFLAFSKTNPSPGCVVFEASVILV